MPLHKEDPRSIGGYRLLDRLGAGGMGMVYRGRSRSGREVALKVVHAKHAQDPVFRARFRHEIDAARRVSGAFTAAVVDADPEADPPWMATQYVPGESLAARIRDGGPLRVSELRPLALGLVEALRDIHRAGVVHRDLKPANVLMAEDGPRVIDFGISRAAESHHTLTETGQVIGTPPFMSPEQFTDARTVGPASDIFSLGALLVYCVTGRGPFDADSPYLTGYRVVHHQPALDGVTGPVRAVLEHCLAKEPADRPGPDELAREFASALPEPEPGDSGTMTLRLPPTWPGTASAPHTTAVTRRPRRRGTRVLLAATGVLAVGLSGWFVVGMRGDDGSDVTQSEKAAASSPPSRWGTLPAGWKPWQTTAAAPAEKGVRKAPGYEGIRSPSCVAAGGALYCAGAALLPERIDATTGRTLWRAGIAPAGVPTERYVTTVLGTHEGVVLVELSVTDEGGRGVSQAVSALDAASGERLWSHPVRTESLGSIYAAGATLTQEGDSSTVTVRSAQDGTVRRRIPLPEGYDCLPLAVDDRPYVECTPQEGKARTTKFFVVDPADGSARTLSSPAQWRSFVGMLDGRLLFAETDERPVTNSPDMIYTRIVLVDPRTAEPTSVPLPERYRGSPPVLTHGTLYFATSSGLVTAVSPTTGARLWQTHTSVETPGPASVDPTGRTVYLAGGSGRVAALDTARGTLLWESSARAEVLDTGPLPPVWFNGGALVLAALDGTVFTLDPAHPGRKPVRVG
ncbi:MULTISPECIES: protein kinase domain-containing protein [unclassified Streptomyces]|uniref:serine/threonine-protein kinase n=1 Tax=unclassified Streptomyces TaxID=2593676 RepID=UPI00036CD7E0|nr:MULTISPECIES: serine/threonine-protein kinase [unclassified Streptomyces]EYT81932.1 serine/threonine protein kinase [Streptomyces sp. Tu 6176]